MTNVIVVFGAATLPSGRPGPSLTARLNQALREARRDVKAPIIVSGGAVKGPAEGPAMERWLVAHGVRRERIIVEAEALYTLDNAMRVAPLIAGLKASCVKLVTSDFHMRRSQTLLGRELRAVTGRAIPISARPASDSSSTLLMLKESAKLARDLVNQSIRLSGHPPKIVRAQA